MNMMIHRRNHTHGFTVIEMLAVLGLVSVFSYIAVINLKEFNNPLVNASAQLVSFFKQIRAEAIAATSAVTIQPDSSTRIITLFGTTCSDPDPVADPQLTFEFEDGAYLTDTDWEFCFNSRGMPDANIEIDVRDAEGATKVVEVLLGGAARIQ